MEKYGGNVPRPSKGKRRAPVVNQVPRYTPPTPQPSHRRVLQQSRDVRQNRNEKRQAVRQKAQHAAQRKNAETILRQGYEQRATRKQKLAALSTALVESNLRNVRYGDRDSLGLFQQRPSQGWGSPRQLLNPSYASRKFYEAAKSADSPSLNIGALAQAVQKSAYPARYSQKLGDAKRFEREVKRRMKLL